MDIYLVIGVAGAVLTLVAFVLNQAGKLDEKHVAYDAMNLISSGMLLVYALHSTLIPFIITNLVWGAVSAFDVVRFLVKR